MIQLISRDQITDYIPQRAPMVMIDAILVCDHLSIRTSFDIKNANIFLTNGKFSESGLLENFAQSAAAMVGFDCHQKNLPVPLGFIGGISKVKIFHHPVVGQTIYTHVEVLRVVFGVTMVRGVCKHKNNR